jgi:hypothetical protein
MEVKNIYLPKDFVIPETWQELLLALLKVHSDGYNRFPITYSDKEREVIECNKDIAVNRSVWAWYSIIYTCFPEVTLKEFLLEMGNIILNTKSRSGYYFVCDSINRLIFYSTKEDEPYKRLNHDRGDFLDSIIDNYYTLSMTPYIIETEMLIYEAFYELGILSKEFLDLLKQKLNYGV